MYLRGTCRNQQYLLDLKIILFRKILISDSKLSRHNDHFMYSNVPAIKKNCTINMEFVFFKNN